MDIQFRWIVWLFLACFGGFFGAGLAVGVSALLGEEWIHERGGGLGGILIAMAIWSILGFELGRLDGRDSGRKEGREEGFREAERHYKFQDLLEDEE
jgi:hypothetical protein